MAFSVFRIVVESYLERWGKIDLYVEIKSLNIYLVFTLCNRVCFFVCLYVLLPKILIRHSVILGNQTKSLITVYWFLFCCIQNKNSIVFQAKNDFTLCLLFFSYLLFPLSWTTRCRILCECYRQVTYMDGRHSVLIGLATIRLWSSCLFLSPNFLHFAC